MRAVASAQLNENNAKLKTIQTVDLDSSGVFKYVLLKVVDTEASEMKYCVRGYARCDYHADIYDVFCDDLKKLKLSKIHHECLGGGRIRISGNTIFIYGYSQGFGQADHALTEKIIKACYPSHDVSWSNEGY